MTISLRNKSKTKNNASFYDNLFPWHQRGLSFLLSFLTSKCDSILELHMQCFGIFAHALALVLHTIYAYSICFRKMGSIFNHLPCLECHSFNVQTSVIVALGYEGQAECAFGVCSTTWDGSTSHQEISAPGAMAHVGDCFICPCSTQSSAFFCINKSINVDSKSLFMITSTNSTLFLLRDVIVCSTAALF